MIKRTVYLVVLLLLLPVTGISAESRQFYVSVEGKDSNEGTEKAPFATLEAARDAVRKLKKKSGYTSSGVTVFLKGGIYQRTSTFALGVEDSGTTDSPVVYASALGEKATISGGRNIPASVFVPANKQFVDKLAEDSAKRHILQVDLKALGINDYGTLQEQHVVDFGSPNHYSLAPLELFIDGKVMTLAQWPNRNDISPRRSAIDRASIVVEKDNNSKPRQYQVISLKGVPANNKDGDEEGLDPILALDRLQRWKDIKDLNDGYVAGGLIRPYAYTTRKITGFDIKQGTITFATPVALWPSYSQKEIHQIYFKNIPYELDTSGEYYIDREQGILYLYPPLGFNNDSRVTVSMLNDVLIAMEGSSHIRIKDLTIEDSRSSGVYIAGGEDNVIENCIIRNTGILGVQIGMGYDAKERKLIPRMMGELRHILCTGMESGAVLSSGLKENTHSQTGTALNVQAGTGNGVMDCIIYNTGCGGVVLGGGDRKTLVPGNNFVSKSEIYHTDRLNKRYAETVLVNGVGNRISGNYLHDSDAGIIYIHGNDHLIEFNEISRAVKTSQDCGAVEIRQNPSQLGNRIVHNYFHDIGRGDNAQTTCIYLDNETCGVEISGNVFRKILGRTVAPYSRNCINVNGGNGHSVSNNLFIDNNGTDLGDGHDAKKLRSVLNARSYMLIKDVNVTMEPYTSRYQEFAKNYKSVMADDDKVQLYNRAYNNVLVGNGTAIGDSRYPDKNYRHDNLIIQPSSDIGFADETAGNYTIKPGSIIFQKLPAFKPILFKEMQVSKKMQDKR